MNIISEIAVEFENLQVKIFFKCENLQMNIFSEIAVEFKQVPSVNLSVTVKEPIGYSRAV